MDPLSPPEGAPNAYDEAEQGTLETHSGPPTVSAPESIDEKVVDGKEVNRSVVFSSEVIPVNNATTSEPPVKRKVSKWILWNLWFNTYRYVSIMSAGRVSDSAPGPTHQKTLYVCGHSEPGWTRPRCVRTFPVCP
jgi:hypothetical protein